MPKQKEYVVSLISTGELVDTLHFGPYAKDWWLARPTKDNTENTPFYPIRPGMKTLTTINTVPHCLRYPPLRIPPI